MAKIIQSKNRIYCSVPSNFALVFSSFILVILFSVNSSLYGTHNEYASSEILIRASSLLQILNVTPFHACRITHWFHSVFVSVVVVSESIII